MQTTDELRAAMRYSAPPARPDTALIIRRGRRRRAARRIATGAVAAGVVTVAVGLAAVLGQPGGAPTAGDPTLGDPTPGNPTAPAPVADGAKPNPMLVAAYRAAPAPAAPDQFDPRRRTLHVGWIPDGLTGELAEVNPNRQTYAATASTDVGVVVIALPAGRPVSDLPSGQLGMPLNASSAVATPTEPVNGRPAECLSDRSVPGSCFAIVWQYAPDAWARASYQAPRDTPVEEVNSAVRKLAGSVTLTEGEPLRLPFTLSGELATKVVADVLVRAGRPGVWSAVVTLVNRPDDIRLFPGTGPQILIEYSRVDPAADPGHTGLQIPNTTVDGHPAWYSPDGRAVVVFPETGLRLMAEFQDLPGDPRITVRDVHPVSAPDDPAAWQ